MTPGVYPASRRRQLHISRFRPKWAKTRSFRCSSFSHRTRFAGLRREPYIVLRRLLRNLPKSVLTALAGVCYRCSPQSRTQRLTGPNRAEVACLIQFSLSRILTWQQDFFLLLFVLFIHFSTICCGASASCAVVCGGKIRQRQNVVVVISLEPLAAFHTPRGLDFADESAVNQ